MTKRVWVAAFSLIALAAAGVSSYHMFRGAPDGVSLASAPSALQGEGKVPGGPAGAPKGPGVAGGPGGAGGPGAMPVPVEVLTVSASAVDDEILSVGTLRSNESVTVRTEVAGRVLKVGFTDGQTVGKGAMLLQIDDSVVKAELAQARAELELAKESLRRVEDLKQKNFVSASALDQASASRDVAQAKVDLVGARLQRFTLISPFAGTVGLRNITTGDYIKEGADVVTVEDLSSMRLDFRLPEKFNPKLRAGITLKATFEAFPGQEFPATVVAIDPQIDPAGRSTLLRARMPNARQMLKPGMLAKVVLSMGRRDTVVLVPEEAIVPQGGDTFIYRVIDGKAAKTSVKLGLRNNGKVEILAGLAVGEQIVVAGQIRINRDQSPVRIVGGAS